ncbi:DUF503 domain-containing protein [candidate division WOR-3 bacterium]|nr:DUF503 domain-containing protein [candidate division WOR-3 bacterium]
MITGTCRIELYIKDSQSLKDKRRILKSMKTLIHNKFNVSISEVDHQDSRKYAVLGIAAVSTDKLTVEKLLKRTKSYIESNISILITKTETEIW